MPRPYVRSGLVVEAANWDMCSHSHETFEISVVLEGCGLFTCMQTESPIKAGHVVLIPAHIPHSYRAHTEMRFGVLEAGNMSAATTELFHRLAPQTRPNLLMLSPIALEQYEALFRQWLRMISQPLKEEDRCIETWVELLILLLLQHQNSGTLPITLAASADYIRANLMGELSISELAKQCGLSESAYRSLFKDAYGLSPKQYQQACRNAEAKWLLRTTSRSIQAIAEQVGFSGVHSFSAWFQKVEGISPSIWRKQQMSRP